ncbi:hypothetical protein HDR58_08035 [bacterium]|nr:hypothetical protein [bacterium]
MSLVSKIVSGAKTFWYGDIATKTINPSKAERLLKYKGIEKVLGNQSDIGVTTFRIKPDISMPMNVHTRYLTNPAIEIKPNLLKNKNQFQQAELGNIALRLAEKYEQSLPGAKKEIQDVFEGFNVSVRAKGANSVFSKLERVLIKKKQSIKTDEEARQIILDAIGGRIQLADVTRKDVVETLNSIRINKQGLSNREKKLILKLFNNEKITEKELNAISGYIKPIKIALAEKQSEPVFEKFILGGLKDALNRKVTTLEELEKVGIRKDLISKLKTDQNIKPLKIGEVNNYKGFDGVSYFSDRQINEFEKLQLATKERFDIITCSENIDLAKYGLEGLSKNAKDAIKPSGYTTAQVNATLKDGTFAEIQVRGSGPFGEYEHLKYDSVLGKNTLGEIYKPYSQAVKNLTPEEMTLYDEYISKTYDYYRLKELNIHIPKPELPSGFNPILSEESMKNLYNINNLDQKEKLIGFIPHVETPNKMFMG